MKSLNEIYLDYKSPEGHGDKGTAHTYIDEYEKLLGQYRENSTVLEIGICQGESLKMWDEYFVNANIYGVDTFEGKQGNGNIFPKSEIKIFQIFFVYL